MKPSLLWAIPTDWALKVSELPSWTHGVAVRLLYLRTINRSNLVTWTLGDTRRVGGNLKTLERALASLEANGLIRVTRQKGLPVVVAILAGKKMSKGGPHGTPS